jgi:CHAD domain-containing protein
MSRALEELAKFRAKPDADVVHDLRVAIRRCRSVAAAVYEIDPHPSWGKLRSLPRKLFRALGTLRDAQVAAEWLKELQPQDDPLKSRLLLRLSVEEQSALKKAARQAEKFDEQAWKKLKPELEARLRAIPADSDTSRCLALERLQEARELHRRALRTETPRPWHELRIGVKRFRYTVESLLPELYEQQGDSLKRIQDVLGNIHDLDVVAELAHSAQRETAEAEAGSQEWDARVAAERQENLNTYRQLSLGKASVWQTWQSAFPRDQWLKFSDARIAATRRALDSGLRRSMITTRLAKRLLRLIDNAEGRLDRGRDSDWRVLAAATRLSGIRAGGGRSSREKAARTFLLSSPLPPGWTFAEWEQVAWAVRFQRGPAPTEKNRRFARLAVEQQAKILRLAGVLRVALALSRFGVRRGPDIFLETVSDGLLLRLRGVEDSPDNAARFTKAKRLLERSMGRTMVMRAEPAEAAETVRPADAEPTLFVVQ